MRNRALGVLAFVLAVAPAARAFAQAADCAPCLEAARSESLECRSASAQDFFDARGACLERDPGCVQACRSRQEDCRDATGIGTALDACASQLQMAKGKCRSRFKAGSTKRENCINRAEVTGFQCRDQARRSARPELRRCRAEFKACADRCGPGEPPRGFEVCKAEARATHQAALATCRQTFQAARSGCLYKDYTCVQGCDDARDACEAPIAAALADAVRACVAQKGMDVAACQAMFPGGGPSLEQCISTADTNAFICRDAARDAAAPGLAVCAQQDVGCVRACPSP